MFPVFLCSGIQQIQPVQSRNALANARHCSLQKQKPENVTFFTKNSWFLSVPVSCHEDVKIYDHEYFLIKACCVTLPSSRPASRLAFRECVPYYCFRFLWLFFQCFFNGLHYSLASILYTPNFDRTAHLADFFAIIVWLMLSSKHGMWSFLISKIFWLRSSGLQFRRNYWYWGSTIKRSNFLRSLCVLTITWDQALLFFFFLLPCFFDLRLS